MESFDHMVWAALADLGKHPSIGACELKVQLGKVMLGIFGLSGVGGAGERRREQEMAEGRGPCSLEPGTTPAPRCDSLAVPSETAPVALRAPGGRDIRI